MIKKYTLVLVDDEIDSLFTLKSFVSEFCPNISVVGSFSSVTSCLEYILSSPPDILLLDINLPDGTGFDVLQKIEALPTRTIFVSAYDQHAVKAFKFKVDNYLLKPVNPNHLQKAVNEVIEIISAKNKLNDLQILEDYANIKKLGIPSKDIVHVMSLHEIIRCEANSNYTYVFIKNKEKVIVPKTIKKFEETLHKHEFIRCHQSHLINQNFVKEIQIKKNRIVLESGVIVPISRKYKTAIIELFKLKII